MSNPFNLVPGRLNINAVSGDDFAVLLQFKDEDGVAINLSSYTFQARILLDNAPSNRYQIITVTNTNLTEGRITLSLSDAQTQALGALSNRKWFITWSQGGEIRTVLSGTFTLNQKWGVTDYSPTTENQTIVIETPTISIEVIGGVGGAVIWGDIQGDIEDQTDLIEYLKSNYQPLSSVLIESYGGVADGVRLFNVSATNGSPIINSVGASFSVGDVGKVAVLKLNQKDYILTTILSRQSSTQITLATNSTSNLSNAQFIYGTDNTNALQDAIDDVFSKNGGEVLAQTGTYLFSGSLNNPSQENSVIRIPDSIYNGLPIHIKGTGLPALMVNNYQDNPSSDEGTIFFCVTKPTGTNPSFISANVNFPGFMHTSVYFSNLTIRVPYDSGLHGLNFSHGGGLEVDYCLFDSDTTDLTSLLAPTENGTAVWFPGSGNSSWCKMTHCSFAAWSIDVRSSEHTSIFDSNFFCSGKGIWQDEGTGTALYRCHFNENIIHFYVNPATSYPRIFGYGIDIECPVLGTGGNANFDTEYAVYDENKVLAGELTGCFSVPGGLETDFSSNFSSPRMAYALTGTGIQVTTARRIKNVDNFATASLVVGDVDAQLPYLANGILINSASAPNGIAITPGGGTGLFLMYHAGAGKAFIGGYNAGNYGPSSPTICISPQGARTLVGTESDDGTTALQVGGLLSSTNFSGSASGANQYYRRNAANNGYEFGNKTDYLTSIPTSGQAIAFNDNPVDQVFYINPAGDLADLQLILPSNSTSIPAQKVVFCCNHNITNLALTGATTIFNAPVSMNSGDCFQFYKMASNVWARVIT